MISNNSNRRSVRHTLRGEPTSCLAHTLKTKFLQRLILGMIVAIFLASTYISIMVISNERIAGDAVTQSHGIHASARQHKIDLLNHVNRKDKVDSNLVSEKIHDEEKKMMGLMNTFGEKVHKIEQEAEEYLGIHHEEQDYIADSSTDNVSVARLPMSQTPALIGANRASIQCDADVKSLAYWNDPQGTQDATFQSPFIGDHSSTETKYISFAPDIGGWNNIRMSLEIIIIMAAASGRTLVLPPNTPFYLLQADTEKEQRGFADFFPLHSPEFLKTVPIISTEEFIEREGQENGRFSVPPELKVQVNAAKKECKNFKKADNSCFAVYDYFAEVGFSPELSKKKCLIFDEDNFNGSNPSDENKKQIESFCGNQEIKYFSSEMQEKPLIHLRANVKEYRLLSHFYGFMLFTNPVINNHYKRFVRDFLHYHDVIFCAAGKIVNSLQKMAEARGVLTDPSGSGGYSSMHVRRGDLQYKRVKIPAEEWNENLEDIWLDDEIIYIATDERNKTFFDPLATHHTLMFLDDFSDLAGLDDLDPNYMGMIDTIVASRGRTFSGTYFSTFSGYINRMRGYHGMTMKSSYYGYKDQKSVMHTWKEHVEGNVFAFEWPTGWVGIDGDKTPNRDVF
eukprot:CAMPEP_0197828014 /NCGR_PEP_ID=MMETSP1437-20131217/4668_1 /TAXON_ID=49252 ORGANISM="Eucampia antarctica, Strain CCMP1452" /NCGR_SAMPLE_ID=MMETSP1437 /ASSEMBLY_ACC=CAM_ASM_001096 /LENGTH=621 /DNA_ID=CAMNT_0043429079 /DNA_START=24 /DNA_END=1889 /DNA_ORIENTATION=+